MGETSGSVRQTRGAHLSEELDSERELWWTGVRALLQANEAEREAIEGYLHLMRSDDGRSLDDREVAELIDAAIMNHQRAVNDLQLAKESVGELTRKR